MMIRVVVGALLLLSASEAIAQVSYQRRVKGSNEGIWLPFTEHGKQGLSD